MTGTYAACLHTNQSRSYMNHLVHKICTNEDILILLKNIINVKKIENGVQINAKRTITKNEIFDVLVKFGTKQIRR